MRYRKRPVEVEVVHWTDAEPVKNIPEWFADAFRDGGMTVINGCTEDVKIVISTLEGPMNASPGDYIIQGVKGELYACKPDIFELTYEPVEETKQPTKQIKRLTSPDYKELGFHTYIGPGNPYRLPLLLGEIDSSNVAIKATDILREVFDKLAKYEDTGYEPEEIKKREE